MQTSYSAVLRGLQLKNVDPKTTHPKNAAHGLEQKINLKK